MKIVDTQDIKNINLLTSKGDKSKFQYDDDVQIVGCLKESLLTGLIYQVQCDSQYFQT